MTSTTETTNQLGADEPEIVRWATIGRPPGELHDLWRTRGNMPAVMAHFAEVTELDRDQAHWRMRAPLGKVLEWDTRITDEKRGERIAWASLAGSGLPNQGSLGFRPAPGSRGTEVELRIRFDPPGGMVGAGVAKFFRLVPSQIAFKALYRFRALAETGEIPTLDRNPAGHGRGRDHQE